MLRTTVVLPDPEPPATPITSRFCCAGSPAAGAPFALSAAVSATLALYMDAEDKVMSSDFIGSRLTSRRIAVAAAFAASLGFAAVAAADQNVTAMLRGGERVTGRFDGFTNGLVYI